MNLKATTEGSFRKTPLPNVLLYLREKRLSGSMVVHIPDTVPAVEVMGDSTLVFEGGSLVGIALPKEAHSVAWVLRELDLITDDALMAAQKAHADTGADEMATLLRTRAVTPTGLDKGLREFNRRRVLDLFGFPDGHYAYYGQVDLLEGHGALRAPEDVLPIVWRGLLRAPPDPAAVQGVLDRIGPRLVRLKAQHEFDRFEFGPETGLAATQLRSGPAGIAQLEGLAENPVTARSMLYLLALTKQIEAVSAPSAAQTLTPATDSGPSVMPTPHAGLSALNTTAASATLNGSNGTPKAPPPPPPARVLTPSEGAPAAAQGPAAPPPPAPAPEAPVAAPEAADAGRIEKVRQDAVRHLKRMENFTYFEMFDLGPKATGEDVRGVFTKVAAAWHPDRAPDHALVPVYTEIFALYNVAFSTLTDPKAREEYEQSIQGGGGTVNAQREVKTVLDSVQDLHRAEIAIKRKGYDEAEPLLRKVLKQSPDDMMANLLLSQLLLETKPQESLDTVQPMLQRVIKATDRNDKAHYLMGVVLKHRGDRRAQGYFRQALDFNPQNRDAQRELRLADMRAKQSKEEPEAKGIAGFFNKLLKR